MNEISILAVIVHNETNEETIFAEVFNLVLVDSEPVKEEVDTLLANRLPNHTIKNWNWFMIS